MGNANDRKRKNAEKAWTDATGSGPKSVPPRKDKPGVFFNLQEREASERRRLQALSESYTNTHSVRKSLTDDEGKDLDRVNALLGLLKQSPEKQVDPLFIGVRELFKSAPALLTAEELDHKNGIIAFGREKNTVEPGSPRLNITVRAALVLGFIELDRTPLPRAMVKDHVVVPMQDDQASYSALSRAFYQANGEAEACKELAALVLPILANEGDADQTNKDAGKVSTGEFARVMRALVAKGVKSDFGQLRRAINLELNAIQAVGDDVPLHEMTADIPDL